MLLLLLLHPILKFRFFFSSLARFQQTNILWFGLATFSCWFGQTHKLWTISFIHIPVPYSFMLAPSHVFRFRHGTARFHPGRAREQ